MTTRREILRRIAAPLVPLYGAREARSIALLAAAESSGLPETAFLTDPQAEIALDGIDAVIEQLAAGRPVQYVTGSAAFLGRRFAVREGVLIPRPETEELTAWILREDRNASAILDVGTGSGCIAVTLAAERPLWSGAAVDISAEALAAAWRNARRWAVAERLAFLKGDVTEPLPFEAESFDLIVSNPPYVTEDEYARLAPEVRDFEPRTALAAGPSGLTLASAVVGAEKNP